MMSDRLKADESGFADTGNVNNGDWINIQSVICISVSGNGSCQIRGTRHDISPDKVVLKANSPLKKAADAVSCNEESAEAPDPDQGNNPGVTGSFDLTKTG
jgi:hypothetical protein